MVGEGLGLPEEWRGARGWLDEGRVGGGGCG